MYTDKYVYVYLHMHVNSTHEVTCAYIHLLADINEGNTRIHDYFLRPPTEPQVNGTSLTSGPGEYRGIKQREKQRRDKTEHRREGWGREKGRRRKQKMGGGDGGKSEEKSSHQGIAVQSSTCRCRGCRRGSRRSQSGART